jgi:glycosyltransferase involved in cell wall biosynthesis
VFKRVTMRILHIDPDDIDNPLSGGGPVRTFEINRRLASRHEITVLTPTFPGSTPEKLRDGIRYVRLGRRIGDHGSSHHITFFFALPRAIGRFAHDLMIEEFMPPASVTANPLFTKAPVIGSVQWFNSRTLAKQYRLPFHWIEAAGLPLYKNLIAVSEANARTLRRRLPRAEMRVIPNGVDERLFEVDERPGDYILYLGRVDLFRKGVGLLLEAYARLPELGRPDLVIAGFGFEFDAVRARVSELGLTDQVRLPGRVDAAGRAKLLSGCRFVCFPSREEMFGMVITESCAAARPVVYWDIPPMNEIADRSGCIAAPAFDVAAYSAAMRALVEAPDAEIIARGRACRARVQDYRWDAVAERQEAFYLERADRAAPVRLIRRGP